MMTSSENDTEIDDVCKRLANRKHGNLVKLIENRDSSKTLCRFGLVFSPLIIGIPVAYKECSRHAQIVYKIKDINMDWNLTYQNCINNLKTEQNKKDLQR